VRSDECPAAALLDALAFGILLLDADARPVHANAEARRLLATGAAGLVVDDGAVRPLDARRAPAWRSLVTAATARRRAAAAAVGDAGVTAVVLAPGRLPGTTVCVMSSDCTGAVAAFAGLHGLTASESDVLLRLVRGDPPKTVALRRGTTEGTVRSQVKMLLAKTRHHSIRALVVDVLRPRPVDGGPDRGESRAGAPCASVPCAAGLGHHPTGPEEGR
jgi:DNA-binding CsgD family transcriptional regulator